MSEENPEETGEVRVEDMTDDQLRWSYKYCVDDLVWLTKKEQALANEMKRRWKG